MWKNWKKVKTFRYHPVVKPWPRKYRVIIEYELPEADLEVHTSLEKLAQNFTSRVELDEWEGITTSIEEILDGQVISEKVFTSYHTK